MNALSFVLSILFRNLMLSCPTVVECSTSFDILEISVQLLLHFRVRGLPVALADPATTFMYGKEVLDRDDTPYGTRAGTGRRVRKSYRRLITRPL
jgi:hypothetical protein